MSNSDSIQAGTAVMTIADPTDPDIQAQVAMLKALVVTAEDGSGNQGFHRPSGLQNGCYYESSWLHFGQPGQLKNLLSIVALLSGAAADFNVQLYYRTDFASSWTLAGKVANNRRATAAGIDVEFYVLQVKVAFDDQTAGSEDIALESVSVLYAYRR